MPRFWWGWLDEVRTSHRPPRMCPSAPECSRWPRNGHDDGRENDSASCNYLEGMVGRDGIEPPTPGFSGLGPAVAEVCVKPDRARANPLRCGALECAGIGPSGLEMGTIWAHLSSMPARPRGFLTTTECQVATALQEADGRPHHRRRSTTGRPGSAILGQA